eukprot:6205228-Pleurochrysis_carterae.AAC.2
MSSEYALRRQHAIGVAQQCICSCQSMLATCMQQQHAAVTQLEAPFVEFLACAQKVAWCWTELTLRVPHARMQQGPRSAEESYRHGMARRHLSINLSMWLDGSRSPPPGARPGAPRSVWRRARHSRLLCDKEEVLGVCRALGAALRAHQAVAQQQHRVGHALERRAQRIHLLRSGDRANARVHTHTRHTTILVGGLQRLRRGGSRAEKQGCMWTQSMHSGT